MTKRKSASITGDLEPGKHGGPQLKRPSKKLPRFNAAARQRFLDALSLCCNITMAAEHVGFDPGTAYRVRRRDPVFAAQWREALSEGLERLETQVVEHGGAGLPLKPADPARAAREMVAPPPFDFDKAIRALQLHAKFRAGVGRKSRHLPATEAETDAAITALLGKLRVRAVAEGPATLALPAPDDAADA